MHRTPRTLQGALLLATIALLAAPACQKRQRPVEAPTKHKAKGGWTITSIDSDDDPAPDRAGKVDSDDEKSPATRPAWLTARDKHPLAFASLGRFDSDEAFDRYLKRVREEYNKRARPRRRRGAGGVVDALGGAAPAQQAAAMAKTESAQPDGDAGGADSSITNNQEAGVDEGDIVKAAGDYFVILRRGRLFTVRQRDHGARALRAVGRANAYPAGGSRGTWYDEMLVQDDRIVVIGFSYRVGGTEIGLFKLHDDGQITHQATHFLRSNDYYSARNYASRLTRGKLIFYMPYYLRFHGDDPPLPAVASWQRRKGKATRWNEILTRTQIYRPVQPSLTPTLHTVVQCDLDRPELSCTARAVIGPYSRTFYVSRDAVYVWVAGQRRVFGSRVSHKQEIPSFLYRMPLLKEEVSAVQTRGAPIDQFSFKQTRAHINVMVTATGGGDWMWNPERPRGKLALLRLPLRAFSGRADPAQAGSYHPLPAPARGRALHNRFVGNWLLWGAGAGWYGRAQNGGELLAVNVTRPRHVTRMSLDHGVERIEAMGRHAMAVGNGKRDLFFTSVELGDWPRVRSTHVRKNAAQGETRSHGFFFLPGRDGGGTLGLPVRRRGRPGRHLTHGSAEVVFLDVDSELKLSPMGALAAHSTGANDRCVVSCVDWYGNARPIFFRGRVFALMGYELVEGELREGRLVERSRINYLNPRLARLWR